MERNREILAEYGGYADLLELRVDCLRAEERPAAAELPGVTKLPVILAARRVSDGGVWDGAESERIAYLTRLVPRGFAYLDVEEDLYAPALESKARSGGCRIIRSIHDTVGVPTDLVQRLESLARVPDELPKAAVTPRSSADLRRLIATFHSVQGMEKILLGMGEHGFCTRVLAGKLGSFLCYSSAPGLNAAPGHTDPRTLCDVYRFKNVRQSTEVFGVMGNPVSHSMSPRIHNTGFAALDLDAVYLPFLADDAPEFVRAAELIPVRGLSVTIPHKRAVLPLLSISDSAVRHVGACNTMKAGPHGWEGTNTDMEGFLGPLRHAFGGTTPQRLRATVIGAGGAARAVVAGLVSCGADVLVLNRTPEHASELAAEFGVTSSGLDDAGVSRITGYRDLIVQTTSVGMEPNDSDDPVPGYEFSGREVVYDLVYKPPVTAFLSRAALAGCRTIPGGRMLLAQALAQFTYFTGREYPRETAQKAMLSHADNG